MFKKLKAFFQGTGSLNESLGADGGTVGEISESDLHVAVAAILIDLAGSDQEIDAHEADEICRLMQRHFGIPEGDIPALIETAMAAKRAQGKLDEFVACLNDRLDTKKRRLILTMIWKIVVADGKVDKMESRFATQMQFRLKLTEEDAAEARREAEASVR